MSMNLSEMAHMVNAARAKLKTLSGRTRGGANLEMVKFIRSIRGDIEEARVRGTSWEDIAAGIMESVNIKISAVTLSKYMKKFSEEDEQAAHKLGRTLAEKHAERAQS